MYIPPGGYVYLFAIYGAVDVIYMCELNKQKNRQHKTDGVCRGAGIRTRDLLHPMQAR